LFGRRPWLWFIQLESVRFKRVSNSGQRRLTGKYSGNPIE